MTEKIKRFAHTSDADTAAFLADCLSGLSAGRKTLAAKWLYDEAGSALFDRICALPEYYPYRTEIELLRSAARQLALSTPYGTTLVELGSGASVKTRILLDAVTAITRYVPIDINPAELSRASATLRSNYPGLIVQPVVADFNTMPVLDTSDPILAFFPGSTLGNLVYAEAVALLTEIHRAVRPSGELLLGIDLYKDEAMLVPAYDDPAGVTAAFNLNLLARINRDLGGDIDIAAFRHRAIWNEASHRIEMHLIAAHDVTFRIADTEICMVAGESIHTENSHKWSMAELEHMFDAAGWRGGARWEACDPSFLVALLYA